MKSPLSLLDIRGTNVQLAAAHYPDTIDESALAEKLWIFIQRFGHSLSAEETSLQQRDIVAVENAVYGLWTYEEDGVEHNAFSVFTPEKHYFSCYSNYDFHAYFGENGLTREQFALWDSLQFKRREAILKTYRDRADEKDKQSRGHFEYGLMVWYLNSILYPGSLNEAIPALTRAAKIAPKNRDAWGLLGIVHYLLGNLKKSNEPIQRAIDLDDADPTFFYYAAQIALENGDDDGWKKFERNARDRSTKIARSFTLTDNPAIRYEEKLTKRAERLRKKIEAIEMLSDQQMAEQDRDAIRIDPSNVPHELQPLIPFALRWGVGDDSSRGYFVDRASAKEKRALKNALDPLINIATAWLDTFAEGEFTEESSAFLYLLEAAEEMRH